MDINQLKSFVTVAHQGNLTQAAEILHLSQPAVTAQIKAIERNLDIILFKRNTQGMSLTPAGEALLPKAEMMLQSMHELDLFAKSLTQNFQATIHVGLIDGIPEQYYAYMSDFFRQKHPSAILKLEYNISGFTLNSVKRKEMHGGFFIGDSPYRNVFSQQLGEIEYVVIVPTVRLAEIDINTPKTLNKLPWIDMPHYAAGYKTTRRFWKEQKIFPQSVMTCNRIHTCITLCASGIGATLIQRSAAEKALLDNKAITILPNMATHEMLSFIYPNEFEHDKYTQTLLEAVRHIWEENKNIQYDIR